MYSRTPRKFSEPVLTTSPHIGPGYYKSDLPQDLQRQQNAVTPFTSVTPRVSYFDEIARKSGPAPGTYDNADLISTVPAATAKAVPFGASKTPRFAEPAVTAPGPGQYDLVAHNDMAQAMRQLVKQSQRTSSHIQWKRKFVPPSIPYASQTAGYDEGPNGELVLRRKAAHLPSHGDFVRENAGTAFAKSTTKRQLWKEASTPGPGNYNVATAWQAFKDKKPEPQVIHEPPCIRFGEFVDVPGPGSYNPALESANHLKKGAILSKAKYSGISPTADPFSIATHATQTETIPGPGAYDVAEATKSRKPLHVGVKPFNSSAPRNLSAPAASGSRGAATPGPGNYSIMQSLVRKPQGTRIMTAAPFGTATSRFAESDRSLAPKQRMPGPASYDPPDTHGHHGSAKGGKSAKRHVGPVHKYRRTQSAEQAAFGTQQKRFKEVESTATKSGPPPGAYNVSSAYSALTQRKIRHVKPQTAPARMTNDGQASNDDRGAFAQPAEGPGPGDYDPIVPPRHTAAHPAVAVFLSRQPRLPEPRHLHPAPNAYGQPDPMVRKTFNTTLEGEHHRFGASVATALMKKAKAGGKVSARMAVKFKRIGNGNVVAAQ
ncbi:hypothetical protein BCR44DRAFT_1514344 [Catenaria anguillulae PL171]|uniref:Uncharacterized protein n=1 Tax=Catenaria anguillulae PL171 TaxID=765915 RepID=A0A1Y2HH65_9FUNG|nr:hypothetical protein BCR44DRAFT_1514344 [Catenaria anguillulae PL171]